MRYGCVVSDATGQVMHYVEKPETFVSDLISCGVYLFNVSIFTEMERHVKASKGHDDLLRLEQDVLRPLANTGTLFVCESREFWRQIKSAGTALPANRLCLYNYHKVSPWRLAAQRKESETDKSGPVVLGDVYIHPTA